MSSDHFRFGRDAFYFLRHGATGHNQSRRIMGQMDEPLAELGLRQAEDAAARLAGCGIRAIHASPLMRAMRTAQIVAGSLGLEPVAVDGLKERHWGIYQDRPRTERPDDVSLGLLDPPGGEGQAEFDARVLAALDGISGPNPVLVVSHNGIWRTLLKRFAISVEAYQVEHGVPFRFEPVDGESGTWRVVAIT